MQRVTPRPLLVPPAPPPSPFSLLQDAASLCNPCSAEVHASNPLSKTHEVVPVGPFSNPKSGVAPLALQGTRVAASANAAEIEEYRRRCEELLNGDEGGGAAPPPAPARHPAARDGPAAHGSGGPGRESASGLQGRAGSGGWKKGGGRGAEPLDQFESLFGSDFAELDSDGPIEFAFLQAQGAPPAALLGGSRGFTLSPPPSGLLTEFGGGFDGPGGLGWQQVRPGPRPSARERSPTLPLLRAEGPGWAAPTTETLRWRDARRGRGRRLEAHTSATTRE